MASTSSKSKKSSFSSRSSSKVSVSLTRIESGSSPYALSERASSARYLRMTSAFSSWKSRNPSRIMSPVFTHTFLRILPRMWHRRFTPSMHCASSRPLPNMRSTCAYSWPSSLKMSSRFSSPSFFPRRRFLPPLPLFFGMVDDEAFCYGFASSNLCCFKKFWHTQECSSRDAVLRPSKAGGLERKGTTQKRAVETWLRRSR
mmetsp:Transcript_12576/g.30539  ORF Transcript_12576/g.30539 Transcript_12576/m.30539 type:complete len:201 (-) Transcript_12576:30-632(-)